MQQLLAEPEDRLGSQALASVSRPDSIVVQARRSGFVPQLGTSTENDGAHVIKVRSKYIGFLKKDEQFYLCHQRLILSSGVLTGTTSTDTLRPTDQSLLILKIRVILTPTSHPRYTCDFLVSSHERKADSPMFQPLAPANGASPDATRDPLLRHKIHGAEIMDVRKALAFAGFTHKSPRAVEYMRADGAFDNLPSMQHVAKDTVRGRPLVRETRSIGLGRAISM